MDLAGIFSGILGAVLGGSATWLFTIGATRRKANGEAILTEADAWKAQQDVYQQTIADLKASCEYIQNDRNILREENRTLHNENNELRKKINALEEQISSLRDTVARHGRRIESLNKRKAQNAQQTEE